jgi:hypothetical protein
LVCGEHEAKLRRFYDRVRSYAPLFLGVIAISLLGMTMSIIYRENYWWTAYIFSMSFVSLGLVSILFPFCTPETIAMMGVAKSITIARIIGGVVFALGVTYLVLALLWG